MKHRGGPRESLDPRSLTMITSGVLTLLLVAGMSAVPVPYAVMSPGPVRDVLGREGDHEMIEISGHETYPTGGSLDMVSVSVGGGPGRSVSLGEVVLASVRSDDSVRPRNEVYPPDATREQVEQESNQEMTSSQESATAAALSEVGIPVPTRIMVDGFSPGADAEKKLQRGDRLLAVNDRPVADMAALRAVLTSVSPGSPIQVKVARGDGEHTTEVITRRDEDSGRTLIGVLVRPAFDFPFKVSIKIEDIGGPSAGMMFALGIVDKLTPGELTGGKKIAGTGTISADGMVGPIGGIQQKMVGARDAGASWFLAPELNCDEVNGHIPQGLSVVKVKDLGEARRAVTAIGTGQGTDALPRCGG